jgi:signal transduction histidine kinase
MAGTLSACPRDESALTTAAPARDATAIRLLSGSGIVRLLQGAVLIHGGALLVSLFHPVSLPSLVILVSGLLVTLLALSVPQLSARPADRRPESASASTTVLAALTELSPPQAGSGALPSPLPFMGERIALNTDAMQLTALARAAARLSRMTTARAHPWGELMARVSHELRTPLNAVIGFSDVMQSELLGPVGHPRYREYARHIGDCGRDLLKSAEDTLAITCLLDHDPNAIIATGVDLKMMVEDAWAFHCGPSHTHGLTLDARIPEDIEVLVDRRPLRQILINLFTEAVRRADARGSVGIVATADGDLVQIEMFLRGQPGQASVGQASLPICLARALLELNGASLIEVDDPNSTWRVLTVLRCVAQCDFFSSLPDTAAIRQPQPVAPLLQVACA